MVDGRSTGSGPGGGAAVTNSWQRRCLAACLLGLVATAVPGVAQTRVAQAAGAPVVVAVMQESGGVNVLHRDFRTADGRDPVYPAGMPRPVRVTLPTRGDFVAQRRALEAGALGHMQTNTLYAVRGTRLLVVNVAPAPYDAVGADLVHATGVADSVTGTTMGIDPKALVVVVLGGDVMGTNGGYDWLSAASWVDLASTSDYLVQTAPDTSQCLGAAAVRTFTQRGHLLFSSAGNTTDQSEPLIAPNGLPETYLVGGVDASGKTWLPPHPEEADPFYAGGNVIRPYETGERFSFWAAAPDSSTGRVHFGGTSGATPRTAAWAAILVAEARRLLRATGGTAGGALASGPHRLPSGPLADGRFTRAELVTLLHAVAVGHSGLPDGPAYALEGYGALDGGAIARAQRMLAGTAAIPPRGSDDTADAAARQARTVAFARCG
jgi:hypothetical protein